MQGGLPMHIAILGLGTVGRGVFDLTRDHPDITVSCVMDRNAHKYADLEVPVQHDWRAILADPSVDVVVEVLGGYEPATTIIREALMAGKHVVTANKAVISRHGKELLALAQRSRRHLRFEAAVGAATIVLDPLRTIARTQRIHAIEGIVNGATNFVLTSIYQDGIDLDQALNIAYEQGYLETGTTDDMDGLDAARKIHILSALAYGTFLGEHYIDIEPLSRMSSTMHRYVQAHGWTMKYMVRSIRQGDQVEQSVHPVVLANNDIRNAIAREWNVITIQGNHHKAQTFIGQGAGRYPTATAVLYDLLALVERPIPIIGVTRLCLAVFDLTRHRYLVETDKGIHLRGPMTITEVRTLPDVIGFARYEVERPQRTFEGTSFGKVDTL
jgi:homoserine dehydrogenase